MSRIRRPTLIVLFVLYSVGLVLGTTCTIGVSHRQAVPEPASVGAVPDQTAPSPSRSRLEDYRREVAATREFDSVHATSLVHDTTRHIEHREIVFAENWLQYALSFAYRPFRQTQNPYLLIKGGAGNCSDRCQILKSLAESAGFPCRFVGLNGHVLLEIRSGGQWTACDPDYGVVYPISLEELVRDESESLLRQTLSPQYPSDVVDRYVQIVQSTEDNVVLPVGSPLSPRLFWIERILGWLSWVIPAACISFGGVRIFALIM